jgi:tetratricopeptide (TPR) repeat protein
VSVSARRDINGIASTGDHATNVQAEQVTINMGPGASAVRSAYRKQVERIAPPELVGRETELRELAAYCTEPGRGAYVWWQAPAWAGKSALISTFVLHPPPGVQVVAFFITARLGGQDTREAFTEVVLEQLAELLEQDLLSFPAATRDAHLLGLLEQAAQACAAHGERLILVVDGLDEDRGVTVGPDVRSIAGLMPHDPPGGMRVVVAGRPDPPIPEDVPGWHRLREPGIIRPLAPSAYAQDIKTLAQQELRRLLRGTPAQQDLLGLLTAARGGLSGPDLAALTGESLWEIEDVLHGVSGRTFTRRVSTWQPEDGPEVYLLGHEELQVTAQAYFGVQRLAGYQDRLHAWAEEYRDRGWPGGTPEYLLSGYFQMLTAVGDTALLAACATDAARHERMLDITGGDAAALNEVTITLDLIAAQDDPDLTAALSLVRHRDYLADRNTNIPASLPALWATLGHHIRAEALAASITDPYEQARALAAVAGAVAEAGQHEQAATVARSITNSGWQAEALAAVAGALTEAGQPEQAATMARSITDPDGQAEALAAVAGALTEAAQPEQAATMASQATTVARSVTNPDGQAQALAAVAGALAKAGQHEQAATMASQATTVARSVTNPYEQAEALTVVAGALAKAGQHEQAAAIASQAATVARSITTNPYVQAQALAAVAGALAKAGQHEQAAAMASQAATGARSITDPGRQARALTVVAGALAKAGQHEQAATMARSITDPGWQAEALAGQAGALAEVGQHEQAAAVARSITDSSGQARALAAVAGALAEAGQHEQAATMARSITDPGWRAVALAEAAKALAAGGDARQARRVASAACAVGPWTTVLELVLSLEPSALRVLTDL